MKNKKRRPIVMMFRLNYFIIKQLPPLLFLITSFRTQIVDLENEDKKSA